MKHKRILNGFEELYVRSEPVGKEPLTADEVRTVLDKVRKTHAWTQSELAAVAGVSAGFLSDVLNGRREPSGALLEFLGLERSVLYVRKPPQEVKPWRKKR